MSQDSNRARPLSRLRSSTTGDLGTSILRSKIKTLNSLAMSSLGNLFSGYSSSRSSAYIRNPNANGASLDLGSRITVEYELEITRTSDIDESQSNVSCNLRTEDCSPVKALDCFSDDGDPGGKQATTTGASELVQDRDGVMSPSVQTTTVFPEVRRMSNSLSRGANEKSGLVRSSSGSETQRSMLLVGSKCENRPEAFYTSNDSSRVKAANLDTPPLTPDSVLVSLPSPPLSLDLFDSSLGLDEFCISDSELDADLDARPISHLQEIREGKKPAKPEPILDAALDVRGGTATQTLVTPSDQSEWYGLEYTLEMSSRERQPSHECTQPVAIGEHSRSRESWAAIHRGTIHPMFEVEGYIQWKNWHRFLDRQEEKRRHRRGALFKTRARQLAWLYVDEVRTREMMYWQKDVYGIIARDVKEKLQYLGEKRPDPFFPPRKHNLAWFLKHSRSIGSIRELKEEERRI